MLLKLHTKTTYMLGPHTIGPVGGLYIDLNVVFFSV